MTEDNAMRAQVKWVEGMQFVARGESSGVALVMDGAAGHGGFGSGARPTEMLLLGLAGCTGMDVISILQKKREKVTGFHMNLKGYRAAEHPRRYTRIEIEYVFRGENLSSEAIARSIELSQTKYCSVSASLNAEIVHTFRIQDGETKG
jgi:putative redox protein